jgi:hypothetical protein
MRIVPEHGGIEYTNAVMMLGVRAVLHCARHARAVARQRHWQFDVEILERVQAVLAFHRLDP